jgi:hypothetical protein
MTGPGDLVRGGSAGCGDRQKAQVCAGKNRGPARDNGGKAMKRHVFLIALIALGACDPREVADKAVRRAAETVVLPVVNRDMPSGPAQAATGCILDAATGAEIDALARDVGVEAGTLTVATIRSIAQRPAAQGCFARSGVPPLKG